MAYEAKRDGSNNQQEMSQEERNVKNNTQNVKNAAEVAMASGNPYAMAAGAVVKGADKLTGGKSSEMLGKAVNQVTKTSPGGKQLQDGLNKLNESGAGDKIGKAASIKNGMSGNGAGGAETATQASDAASAVDKASSSPASSSTGSEKSGFGNSFGSGFGGRKKGSSFFDDGTDNQNGDEETSMDTMFQFTGKMDLKKVAIFVLPAVGLLLIFMIVVGAIGGGVADFDDALGASSVSGGETGNIVFEPSSQDAADFYDRINTVKLALQANGRSVDVLKIAAVYHVLNVNNNEYDYDYMTTHRIYEIANSMFNGNTYNEETFRYNLTNVIFKKYFPTYSQSDLEQLTDDVFDYIERYFSFIGYDATTCASAGTCNYEIKGFYIDGAGNISKQLQISNLMVRLMECGSPYGNGNYETAIDQDLVAFEDYVAGVAYAEIGTSAPIEAIKAQMVAARSFALARPTGMGNGLGKKLEEENGQWILQIASCVSDQVFCNIDEGCSYMGGGDGQGGICRSGKVAGAIRTRDALALDHQIRTAAAATVGEVLVNEQGYIIQTGYTSTEQNQFISLANQGMNYKQILLQVYNSGKRDYNASDVQKMSCNTSGSSNCGTASTGPYASWKQYEGPWTNVYLGNSGKTIKQIGCLATSVAILIAKSGVPTVLGDNFNPGTFVEYLSQHNGFVSGGNFVWASASLVAPTFVFQNRISVSGYSKEQKLSKITELLSQGYYVVAEVKGNTGQHWVAIDAVAGSTVIMMDPGSASTDLWAQYDWRNTSTLAYYKVG